MSKFTHLHVHTQYSILEGAASITSLIKKAKLYDMKSLAITDNGNMYGVLSFVNEATANGIKPIIGCEAYVAHNSRLDKHSKDDRINYHLILLAKNYTGYKNLSNLITIAFKEGNYYKPRIDKEILKKYSEGLIATSACLKGEIQYNILKVGIDKAEEKLKEYLDIFGDDFYLEIMRHGNEEEKLVNEALIKMAEKYKVKLVATNDVHFVNKEDAEAHDILICLNNQQDIDDVKSMGYSGMEYFKTSEEMSDLFKDLPQAIESTQEIDEKIEEYEFKRNIILPVFNMPENFKDADIYLSHLTNEGAKTKYKEITPEIQQRIDFELSVVKKMGFSKYFLIVRDIINEAKRMGVMVGPGRGEAVGSIIAYCIGIISIDPIHYNLLFEKFMNPERVSIPIIDIDFDNEGKAKLLEYVCNKYGREKVSQIISFSKIGPKMAIRDVARVMKLPIEEADKLTKMVPEKSNLTFKDAYSESPELKNCKENGTPIIKKILALAEVIEGSIRNVGTHACGVIIGPESLANYVPLATAKDTEFLVSQYEDKFIDSIGLLKMDFLGLKTLSIIKKTIKNIKQKHNIDIDIESIPYDNEKTFELFKQGNTIGVFLFESEGMRTYLRSLKPADIEDLIALNALYRPCSINYIPNYIARKHKKEKVSYEHPLLEPILKNTYGIMIYQEQIMQVSQAIGNFSGAKADELRKAMGKKNIYIIKESKKEFIDGAKKNNIKESTARKIFEDMVEYGKFAFNRSHAVAYTIIAYQTAWLKANYPSEFMSAVTTYNNSDIKDIN